MRTRSRIQTFILCISCTLMKFTVIGLSSQKPNVLFVVVDDLRPALGCYGNPVKTPNIDQLAAQSISFLNAHAQQALCAPSRASFLTSRRPDSTRVYDLRTYWREVGGNFTTLPQYFKENGYFTASIGKVFHHGKAANFTDDYPYSWSVPAYHPPTDKYKREKVCLAPDGTRHEYLLCPVDPKTQPGGSLPDIQSAEYAVSLIQNISKPSPGEGHPAPYQPFFLGIGFHKPHVPFKFPKEFLNLYPIDTIHIAKHHDLPASLPTVAFEPYSSIREREDIAALNLSFPYGPVPDIYHRLIRQHYYAATSYVDSMIGHVLHALEENSLADNTIITLIGDHGWQLGENSEFAKFSNYAAATNVPFLVYVPPSLQQKRSIQRSARLNFQNVFDLPSEVRGENNLKLSSALVELVDLFPTLAELAGLPAVDQCPEDAHSTQLCTEGISLLPLMESVHNNLQIYWKNCSFSQYPRPSDIPQNDTDIPDDGDRRIMGYTLRTLKYRYAEWVGFDPVHFKTNWKELHARELYDHVYDPDEHENVVEKSKYEGTVKELARALRKGWKHCLPKS